MAALFRRATYHQTLFYLPIYEGVITAVAQATEVLWGQCGITILKINIFIMSRINKFTLRNASIAIQFECWKKSLLCF